MEVRENQVFFHCEFCGSYDFPDPNLDGVALLDEVSPYACPICHKPLVAAIVNNVHILSCPVCRGNLVSQSKMLPILRQAQPLATLTEELQYSQPQSELSRNLICPSCKNRMAVYPYGGSGNVMIQGCARCRLIWLDFGELSRIIRSFLQIYDHHPDELGAKKQSVEF